MATEYEVESILKAKVFMKGKKMAWKFYVKWKGYEDSDNTWEPFKSFEDCGEGIVERFWDRVDTKGRDINSVDGWTNGEEVLPTGPIRRTNRTTPKTDGPVIAESPTNEQPLSRSRRATNGAKSKRPREASQSPSSSKRKRASSSRRKSDARPTRRPRREAHTPVPDSEPEDELLIASLQRTATDDIAIDADASGSAEPMEVENSVGLNARGQSHPGRPPTPSGIPDHDNSQSLTSTMVDELNISALPDSHPEAEELVVPQIQSAKNGSRGLRGRNASLLTFSKKRGGLETLKRSSSVKSSEPVGDTEELVRVQESNRAASGGTVFCSGSSNVGIPLQDRDGTPPAAEQTKLSSHDDIERRSPPDFDAQNFPCPSSPSIELPDKMPTSISFPEPPSGGSSPWKRATIFGPLATGTCLPTWATSPTSDMGTSSIPKPFLLSLDNSVSVPVALKDISSAHNLPLESVVSGSSAGPPGKLYTSHAANALLETLETGGSCARLVPGETATSEERRMFDAFCTKLGEGGLFLVMASSDVLACYSSTNEDYTKRLELAAALRGLSETVVVSHVKVANYSAFADAAAQAENVHW